MDPQEVEQSFEQIGVELGLEGAATVAEKQTTVVYEDEYGHQHLFVFVTRPDIEW
ncbi:MAG: hypothetical protein JO202_18395 [Ktedonobacteraceae bacterium]|nr:hypothetical protein [Ktedonobacteraceae bacterium]